MRALAQIATAPPPGALEGARAATPAVPEFDIVPRVGMVLAAIAAVLIVVAVAVNKLWPLEFLHVTFGAAWTIVDLFVGLIVGPIIGRLSVPARIEFTTKFMPKMVVLMPSGGGHADRRLAALHPPRDQSDELPPPRVGGRELHRRRRDGDHRARVARAGHIGVLIELKKPRPNPAVIERLMKRLSTAPGCSA